MFRLPTQVPIEEYPSLHVFVEEAKRLVKAARDSGITLRIMGGMAVYLRCHSEFKETWMNLKRLGDRIFTDIDFVSYGKHKPGMIDFMKAQGYQTDPNLIIAAGRNRQIFFGGKVPMVEVFYDKLIMCHTIDYAGRLEKDTETVPLADLMLQKLQIVKINDKDIKDLVALIATHDIGPGNPEKIDIDFVNSAYMQSDWGFYYTATTNLAKVAEAVKGFDMLKESDRMKVSERVTRILGSINDAPKTAKWKLRSRVGPKVKWYEDVDGW